MKSKSLSEAFKKYHPDINKESGADEKFKEVKEAYEALSDDQKRAQYDHSAIQTLTRDSAAVSEAAETSAASVSMTYSQASSEAARDAVT